MKRWLLILSALSVLLLSGCGAKSASTQQTSTTNKPGATIATAPTRAELKMEECYTFIEHDNGTYSYEVTDCYGETILAAEEEYRPVSFEKLNDDVLIVQGQAGVGIGARWARFCDIRTGRVSQTRMFYLAAWKDRAAFVDYRTDDYHVFVTDPFDSDVYYEVYTMDGVSLSKGDEPVADFELSKKGILSVTYPTKSGEKTIEIDLNAK